MKTFMFIDQKTDTIISIDANDKADACNRLQELIKEIIEDPNRLTLRECEK